MAATGLAAAPPAPEPVRPRAVLVGTALAAGASFIGIMALVGIYLGQRAGALSAGRSWLPDDADIPLTPANMAMFTMVLSGLTIWWAVDAARTENRMSAYLALGLTVLFGVAVVNATVFIVKVSGIPVAGTVGLHFHTVVGAFLLLLIGALLYVGSQALRTFAGDGGQVHLEGITSAALLWTAAVIAHGVIWIAVYIAK